MSDPERVAQAQAREIPVTIQGSKAVEGTDRRELFTETAVTKLTFDNGATLSLQSRVSPGQSLFLRNERSGREILCRVVETPSPGQTGYTDLQFTVPEPGFWGVQDEQPSNSVDQAAPAPESATGSPNTNGQHAAEAAHENPLAMMSSTASSISAPNLAAPGDSSSSGESSGPPREELMGAHEQAPQPPASQEAAQAPQEPAHKSHDVPEFNQKKFEETLAALLEGESKRAKRAAAAKEKEAAKSAGNGASQGESSETGEAGAGGEAEVVVIKPTLEQRLTTGKGAVIVGVCASMVNLVCLFYIWRAVYHPGFIPVERTAATSVASKQKPQAAAARPGVKTVSAGASAAAGAPTAPIKAANASGASAKAPGNGTGAAPAQLATKSKQPEPAQAPTIPVANGSGAASAPVGGAPESKALASSLASPGPRVVVSRNAITADSGTQPNLRKPGAPDSDGNVPARIVSEIQPAFPDWAKSLDVDGVVTLDATIDEKGNVMQTKVLSGPRPLQHAAEQAVGLWIFQPAQQDGKAVASHMTLTVEFQR